MHPDPEGLGKGHVELQYYEAGSDGPRATHEFLRRDGPQWLQAKLVQFVVVGTPNRTSGFRPEAVPLSAHDGRLEHRCSETDVSEKTTKMSAQVILLLT